MTDPWDRRKDEPLDRYAWFLIYRNLGPSRTIPRAYRKYLQGVGDDRPASVRVPGHWCGASATFNWLERAAAWDVQQLQAYGARAAVCYVRALERMARKLYAASGRCKPGDPEWPDLIRGVLVLGDWFERLGPGAMGPEFWYQLDLGGDGGDDPGAESPDGSDADLPDLVQSGCGCGAG